MKHVLRKFVTVVSAAVLTAASLAMFTGCNTKHPTVSITYTFNGKDYKVDYTLSRNDAPQTVQHFLELASAGYYDGMCIHDYDSDGLFLKTGGYKLVEGELEEVDYFSAVKALEAEGHKFTQSVWTLDGTPLYTVYGEFEDNGVRKQNAAENTHQEGALVMYYTEKGNFNGDVKVKRADDGKEQEVRYKTNSITSLFYTFTGSSNFTNDSKYCVIGMADDYEKQMTNGLLKAIDEYAATLGEEATFTEEVTKAVNKYEPFDAVKDEGREDTYAIPLQMPIVVKSVKVNKY